GDPALVRTINTPVAPYICRPFTEGSRPDTFPMKMRSLRTLAFLFLLVPAALIAQWHKNGSISTGCINELTGQSCDEGFLNTITTAVPFLLISPDSRAGGMGDAGVAVSPDAN